MENKNYLLITLGHNSSAIFVDNTDEKKPRIIGYEQERLSRIKADSQFPKDAIFEIIGNINPNKLFGCTILVSHWFNFNDCSIPNKYITKNDLLWLEKISKNIKFVSSDFTHHDAHAYSAYSFYKYHCHKKQLENTPVHCIVADGFGNDEEVLSIYSLDLLDANTKPKCIHRVYGYYNSLGLFYQYATSFVGMKENQDEYKFLGYEAHIDEILNTDQINILNTYIGSFTETFINHILSDAVKPSKNELSKCGIINCSKLSEVKQFWYNKFDEAINAIGVHERAAFNTRCVVAYLIQQTVEAVFSALIEEFNIKNLCVAGGCFYNVKLNNKLLSKVPGLFSAFPLAGDQGAAIGMYAADNINQFPFDNLAWGKRRLYNFEKIAKGRKNVNFTHIDNKYEAERIAKHIATLIANGNIVDLVYSKMEFGPRALCNTSTLFLPTADNVKHNNIMNERNEVMPCAPVCTQENAIKLFGKDILRVIGSNLYMICTHEYMRGYSEQYGGVMHKKTLFDNTYTGRPQIVHDGFMRMILDKVEELTDTKCLVNTSFNVHGQPIVFDTMDILQNHEFQMSHARCGKEPILFVIETE